MAKHKKNSAIEAGEIKHKEVLEITAIQDADGNAYVFVLWARSEMPRYRIYISPIENDGVDLGFEVDPYSLQKMTAASAAVQADKSKENKRIQIEDVDGMVYEFKLWSQVSLLPLYTLAITHLGFTDEGIEFPIDFCGLQKLTAWFAQAVVRVSTYEADHPNS